MTHRYMDFIPPHSPHSAKRPLSAPSSPAPRPATRTVAAHAQPVAKTTLRSAVKPAVKSTAKSAPKPTPKPTTEPTLKPVAQPVATTTKSPVEPTPETLTVTATETTFFSDHIAPAIEPEFGVIEDYRPTEPKPVEEIEITSLEVAESSSLKPSTSANASAAKAPASKTFVPPSASFINTEKIEKRPLSKNVYKKPLPEVEETPSGPITIITPPEKDAHINIIVAIILTIILGAAAGTIAFLLLPR